MFQGTEVSAQIKFQGTEVRILSLGKVGAEHSELESMVSRESSARFDSLTHGEPSFTWFHRVSYYLGLERILRVKVARDLLNTVHGGLINTGWKGALLAALLLHCWLRCYCTVGCGVVDCIVGCVVNYWK